MEGAWKGWGPASALGALDSTCLPVKGGEPAPTGVSDRSAWPGPESARWILGRVGTALMNLVVSAAVAPEEGLWALELVIFKQQGREAHQRLEITVSPSPAGLLEGVQSPDSEGGDILITSLDSATTFDELCEEVREMCHLHQGHPLTLKWVDSEGDPCTVSSQMELEEAFRLSCQRKDEGLILHVFPSIPEEPGMPCPGEDSEYRLSHDVCHDLVIGPSQSFLGPPGRHPFLLHGRAVASSPCWPAVRVSPKHLCISGLRLPSHQLRPGPRQRRPEGLGPVHSVPDSVPSWLHPRVDAALGCITAGECRECGAIPTRKQVLEMLTRGGSELRATRFCWNIPAASPRPVEGGGVVPSPALLVRLDRDADLGQLGRPCAGPPMARVQA
ncbi:hypothetical protein J1605_000663 [Eschrichtius robustus]|uniref:PB1 domain-containing protein n=1 Tax=Eschrichtius robustus TaxID=9764 RepID=A0AB34GPG8_ESCRO|nr:hypothetical protein J1605_000663 [Eschrichtius robustus]